MCIVPKSLLPVLLALGGHALAEPPPPPETPFDFAAVERLARLLATEPYSEDRGALPDEVAELSYEQYREIRYLPERSLWRDDGLPFQLEFFHRGSWYKDRVQIKVLEQGPARAIPFAPEAFDYGRTRIGSPLPADMGFAGLKVLYALRWDGHFDDVASFLGASYYRAAGLGQVYGIAARGLALDTGLAKAEEFPLFREFWIERPARDADTLTFYGLLDGPSATGAFRFILRPGLETVIEVKARIYLRQAVERFGVAPLTSMFFYGENAERRIDDVRPEVHSSDGLLLRLRNGEWVWRPLNNPRGLAVSVFEGDDLAGFGLMQRDREFDHYQDLDSMYHLRPSAWVEPLGPWGPGAVYLIEIPSDAEKYDNIVAFWVPERASAAGQDWAFEYRVHFQLDTRPQLDTGRTLATRVGGMRRAGAASTTRRFVTEFTGDSLSALGPEAPVEAVITGSAGSVENVVVHKNLITGGWRLAFELHPPEPSIPVDLRAYLKLRNVTLTETWIYQWSPP